MDRRRRYGEDMAASELDDLQQLFGSRPSTVAAGLADLDDRIAAGSVDDDVTVRYLTRRALRDEWLWAPAVTLYPERRWADID